MLSDSHNSWTNREPLVSIIIPLYNAEQYIGETIRSVLGQTYKNFEIIVVNDGSTDKSEEVVKAIAKSDGRITLLTIPNSARPSVPRNYGISKARGQFIAFLDADDIWMRDKLENQIGVLVDDESIGLISSRAEQFGTTSFFSKSYGLLPLNPVLTLDSMLRKNSIPCSTVVLRRNVLDICGTFDEDPNLIAVEDYDLWLRVLSRSKGYMVPNILVRYRVHSSGASFNKSKMSDRVKYLKSKNDWPISIPVESKMNGSIPYIVLRNTIHFFVAQLLRVRQFIKPVFRFRETHFLHK
jgi:glycosyltransferase involved in cell wall biosynthesis